MYSLTIFQVLFIMQSLDSMIRKENTNTCNTVTSIFDFVTITSVRNVKSVHVVQNR